MVSEPNTILGAMVIAVGALATAIRILWVKMERAEKECREDRILLWREVINQNKRSCANSGSCEKRIAVAMPQRPNRVQPEGI